MTDNQPIADPITTTNDVPASKPATPNTWLVAAGVILIGLVALVTINTRITTQKTPAERMVDNPTPTPTPIRILSAIATQSAFIALEQTQASLSSGLAETNLDDPSLSPPVLDLPLGFRQ